MIFWKSEKAPRNFTVLSIDDSSAMQLILAKTLKALGYDMLTAPDGHQGVLSALKHRPDLILLDVTMPVMNGIEALTKLKQDPNTASIPVLMCSSEQTGKDLEKAFGLGAAGYLIKPVNPDRLKAQIDKLFPPRPAP